MGYFEKWRDGTGKISGHLGTASALFLIALTAFTVFCVVARYVFNSPYIHSDEISRYIVAWVVLLGMAYCLKTHTHIRLDIVISRFKGRARLLIEVIVIALGIVWLVIMFAGCWQVWLQFFIGKDISSLGFLRTELWIPSLALVVGISLFLLQALVELVTSLRDFLSTSSVNKGHRKSKG
jgi:C4-dicarboxylate transporter DctQ subunit